jgi:hypothetical protein
MTTLNTHAKIGQDGRLLVDVATTLPAGEVEVQVIIRQSSEPRTSAKFGDLAGRLSYQGDPMLIQKELRDEWPE